jgi:outer membrane biosynthesis protein TonB
MKRGLNHYWRLRVTPPSGVEEVYDLRQHSQISVGDDSSNTICIDTTEVPFHFSCIRQRWGKILLTLTDETKGSLKGETRLKKSYKSKLYQLSEFEVSNRASFKIAGHCFELERCEMVSVAAYREAAHPLERKHWRQSFVYTIATYSLIILLSLGVSWIQKFFSEDTPIEVQKVSLEVIKKKIEKERAVPAEVKELEVPPPVKQTMAQATRKTKPQQARKGASRATPQPQGLLALQGSKAPTRAPLNLAQGTLVASRESYSDVMGVASGGDLGMGLSAEGDVQVAKLGGTSVEAYQGGLSAIDTSSDIAAVQITRREVEVRGALDPAVIRQIIEERLSEIRYCYENSLLKNDQLSGKVAASWTIQAAGDVADIKTTVNSKEMGGLESCVQSQIARWKFPEPKGGGRVHVRYPFVFNPVGGKKDL